MVTPKSIGDLRQEGIIKESEFAYGVNEFMAPYEDFMILHQPIHQHLVTLNFIVREFNLKDVLEIGTEDGHSTIALAFAVKETGGNLHSIDINPCMKAVDRIRERKLDKYWTFHSSRDSLIVPWNRKIDCLFIDSGHSYDQMLGELTKYEPFVKKEGFIILHDIIVYRNEDMCKAIDEYFNSFKDSKKYRYYRWFNDCGLGVVKKLS